MVESEERIAIVGLQQELKTVRDRQILILLALDELHEWVPTALREATGEAMGVNERTADEG